LSEVLICLLLASLILTGLIKQYAQVYRQDSILNSRLEQTSDLQLVGELLRNSLRGAGFTPCGNLDDLQNEFNSELSAVKFIPNSIEIARMNENYFEFSTKVDALQFLNKKIKLQQFMITDCFHAVVVTNDSSSLGWNAVLNFIESNFIQPIYIGEYVNERFWIKDAKNFYYKFKHSEKLSDYIKSMETSWLENNFVQVKFILMDKSVQKILVKVRNKT